MPDEEFEGAEGFRKGDIANLSFREIVLMHLRRITQLSCVEFRGGYWNEKTHAIGGMGFTEKIYIPDSRECYVNAVDMFSDLLLPIYDKTAKKEIEDLETSFDNKYKLFEKQEKKGKDIMQKWKQFKLKNKRQLFRELSLLLKRLKYLEGKSFGEEV